MSAPIVPGLPPPGTGSSWEVAHTIDWTAEPVVDIKAVGSIVVNGVTWTLGNAGAAAVFGTTGAGLAIEVSSNCGIGANNCPELGTGLAGLVDSLVDDDEVHVMHHLDVPVASNGSRFGSSLRRSGSNMFFGTHYLSSPGREEPATVTAASQYTDPNIALGGDTDRVVGGRYLSGVYQMYNHGLWSGAWPTGPSGGTLVAADSEPASAAKSSILIPLTLADLLILGLRGTSPNPTALIKGTRILVRRSS